MNDLRLSLRHCAFHVVLATGLVAFAPAQCPAGATAGLVKWDANDGYAGPNPVHDEGLTSPPIALTAFSSFPMAGAIGTLDRIWVNSNGEIYFTDSTANPSQPAGGALFGVSSLAEMRGVVSGGSARVVVLGGDHQASTVAGNIWEVSVDQSTAGEVRVTWTDMARFQNTTDRFSFGCKLFASGAIELFYGNTFPAGFADVWVGISIGNLVGGGGTPSRDLTASPDSGTLGLLHQYFPSPASWDLAGKRLTISPNGTGGYTVAAPATYTPPTCATHATYGVGCYDDEARQAIYQTWTDAASSATARAGTSMTFSPTVDGFLVTNGGGIFVAPSPFVSTLALGDDTETNLTPSVPFPYAGGTVSTLSVCSNGFVSMGPAPTGNSLTSYGAVAPFLNQPVASFRSNSDYDLSLFGGGNVVWEEVTDGSGNQVLVVTWANVERYSPTVTNPETFQFQLSLSGPAAGRVIMVWQAMTTLGTQDLLVGYAPASPSMDPGSRNLATALPITTAPDVTLLPLTLTAGPRPVITLGGFGPTVPMNYTVGNVPPYSPTTPISLVLLVFSPLQIQNGLDLGPAGIDVGMGGCNLHIGSLDVIFPGGGAGLFPTVTFSLTVPQPILPGVSFYSQAFALVAPGSLPNGQNPFGGIVSNGLQSNFHAQ